MPLAVTLKLAAAGARTVWLAGWAVSVGGTGAALTDRVALPLVALP